MPIPAGRVARHERIETPPPRGHRFFTSAPQIGAHSLAHHLRGHISRSAITPRHTALRNPAPSPAGAPLLPAGVTQRNWRKRHDHWCTSVRFGRCRGRNARVRRRAAPGCRGAAASWYQVIHVLRRARRHAPAQPRDGGPSIEVGNQPAYDYDYDRQRPPPHPAPPATFAPVLRADRGATKQPDRMARWRTCTSCNAQTDRSTSAAH